FPYPLMTTCFQLFMTWLLVLAAARFTRTITRFPVPREIQLALTPRRFPNASTLPLDIDDLGGLHARSPLWRAGGVGPAADNNAMWDWSIARRVLPLAAVYAAKVVLSNLSFAQAQLSMYLLTRIAIIPLSLVLTTALNATSHSASTISSSLIATLNLLIATTSSTFHVTPGSLALGLLSSFFTALYPIMLLQTYRSVMAAIVAQQHAHSDADVVSPTTTDLLSSKAEWRAFWLVLRYTAMMATLLVAPLLLLSNEWNDMQRNCYVLDVKVFWTIFICSGIGGWFVFVFTLLLVRATSPLTTTFLSVPRSAFSLLVLSPSRLPLHTILGILMCWLSSLWFLLSRRTERMTGPAGNVRNVGSIIRNLMVAGVVYGSVYQLLYWCQTGLADWRSKPALAWNSGHTPTINVHANWINRPESAVVPIDDYLGRRPHTDTVANLSLIVSRCSGFYLPSETNHDGLRCLEYLASSEQEYFVLPKADAGIRASEQDPVQAEYADADGHGNTLSQYVTPSAAEPASKASIGTCAGPIIPFHVYWTGPASWRVELFIKSYLYTQHLPCSRLWLWVDADRDPEAPEAMLHRDPLFERFRPLVERGDVVVKHWRFPERLPLPGQVALAHQKEGVEPSALPMGDGEIPVADGVVQDAEKQRWLVFPPRMALFPEVVSDLVRFVVLHLHGGVYCDMDILLLRDFRPLLLPDPVTGQHAFAEHWVERSHPADYNTAVMSLTANSSLSTYLLHGGVRMGMNYHPKVIGRMAWKDRRNDELLMLDTAFFDPSTTTMNHVRGRQCTVPCHTYYSDVFEGKTGALPHEWRTFHGEALANQLVGRDGVDDEAHPESAALDYVLEEDPYRPRNRTLQNFFRGAWAYHIHNQWSRHPEPSSWLDAITHAQDGFFDGLRTNSYGEQWDGPALQRYNRWPEFT
ncbi:MAG: hypothetical protein M1838_004722, partial [Thelocarpon superellum]